MIQLHHDELTSQGENIEAEDLNGADALQKCPVSSNGTARQEEGSAVMDDEQGIYFDMDEEDDEELFKMLEEDVVNPNDKKAQNIEPTKVKTKVSCYQIVRLLLAFPPYFVLQRLVVEKGKSKFDVLPDGWVTLCHDSGLQIYMHKQSRVVCMSRPFFVGRCNARVSLTVVKPVEPTHLFCIFNCFSLKRDVKCRSPPFRA